MTMHELLRWLLAQLDHDFPAVKPNVFTPCPRGCGKPATAFCCLPRGLAHDGGHG